MIVLMGGFDWRALISTMMHAASQHRIGLLFVEPDEDGERVAKQSGAHPICKLADFKERYAPTAKVIAVHGKLIRDHALSEDTLASVIRQTQRCPLVIFTRDPMESLRKLRAQLREHANVSLHGPSEPDELSTLLIDAHKGKPSLKSLPELHEVLRALTWPDDPSNEFHMPTLPMRLVREYAAAQPTESDGDLLARLAAQHSSPYELCQAITRWIIQCR